MATLDESGFRDSSPSRNPPSQTKPHSPRARHYYAVDRGTLYSLRDAALALEMPEGKLRRAILLDELPAADVDDERQYLMDGAALQAFLRRVRPFEHCVFPDNGNLFLELAYCLVIPLLILLVLIFARTPDSGPTDATTKKAAPADSAPAGGRQPSPPASERPEPAPAPYPPETGGFPNF